MTALRNDHLATPHPSRFSPARRDFELAMRAHALAVAAGRDTYRDPVTGYAVFTASCLAARGRCCATGCRHCPYVGAA